MKNDIKNTIIKVLKADGVKITKERELLLDVFLDNPNLHFDFTALLNAVRKINSRYGIATLYRNLKLLIQKDILSENTIKDTKYYELKMFSKKKIHIHLICNKCGSIDEYFDARLIEEIVEIRKKYNFDIYYGELNFYGICSKCSTKT
ncbi:transcriptional repressor [Aceticella autotrophica]|uniref:Transcriptional repressor n=1 Tax=Aceticella autotrophica TaxID=2755338 RepID=A0A975AV25_9THEO|nr:transcriptional repressor [Aceticella autotrophica]QSZ26977.1 transcriptional repressor [Aceticella autotrophica]